MNHQDTKTPSLMLAGAWMAAALGGTYVYGTFRSWQWGTDPGILAVGALLCGASMFPVACFMMPPAARAAADLRMAARRIAALAVVTVAATLMIVEVWFSTEEAAFRREARGENVWQARAFPYSSAFMARNGGEFHAGD